MEDKVFFQVTALLIVTIMLAVILGHFVIGGKSSGVYAVPIPGHASYGKPCTTSADCADGAVCRGDSPDTKTCVPNYSPF